MVFFRVGELVANSKTDYGHALLATNIRLVRNNMVEIRIPHSKTDQAGLGTVICLPTVQSLVCPVQGVINYSKLRPPFQGVYFRHQDGSVVTRYQFSAILAMSLEAAGMDSKLYKRHSFRIGSATMTSLAGFSGDDVARFGRWRSNAYKSYIRIPTQLIK